MLSGNQRGILFILIGMTISSVQDTLIKLLSDDLSIFQIQFFRSLVGIGVIIMFQIALRQPVVVTTAYPVLSLLRGIMFFGAYSLFYFAQSKIPIANATVLYLSNPFFTTLIAILIFKSQVGFKHWLIIIFGFFGVVLIYQPNTKVFNVYYLLPILVALLYSLIVTITKLTSNKDTLFQQLFYTYLVTVVLSGLLGLIVGDGRFDTAQYTQIKFLVRSWQIFDLSAVIWLLTVSIIGTTAHAFFLAAYRIGDPSVISPYEYTLLPWMILWGFVFWSEVPSFEVLIGMLLIVGSGLVLFYNEQAKNKK